MNAWAYKLPALLAAALFVLPPGYCCWPAASRQGEQTAAAPACPACQQHTAQQLPVDSDDPARPPLEIRCCCPHEAVLPDFVSPPDQAAAIAAACDFGEAEMPSGLPLADPDFFDSSGPRLHVLQCVWRC